MDAMHVRGVGLAYEFCGDGPTVVWGHGLTSSMAKENDLGMLDWPSIRRHARVLRYDARGHGASDSTADPQTYHWRELALDQLALTTSLGIDVYVAGGASMGCATALHAAIIAPERIAALLLVIPPTAWETRTAQQGNYELAATLVDNGQFDVLLAGAAATPPPDPLVGVDAWADGFERTLLDTDPVRLSRIFRGAAIADLPSPGQIATIDVPVTILAWTGDPGHPVTTAERLADLLPQATLSLASTFDELRTWTQRSIDFLGAV